MMLRLSFEPRGPRETSAASLRVLTADRPAGRPLAVDPKTRSAYVPDATDAESGARAGKKKAGAVKAKPAATRFLRLASVGGSSIVSREINPSSGSS